MEITITWTKIIVLTISYFSGRYLYFSFLKYYTGCPFPFDPTEFYETSSYEKGWNMGYIHGSHKYKIRCEKYRKQIAEVKEKYSVTYAKLRSLEDQ
ncbi:hypothetical protein [Mucilaginibacter sp.]|uniref:hypothetical protein n=1 Tax=Mucilaginibacter sp. TaxID=1882438 RepID=UPI003D14CABE